MIQTTPSSPTPVVAMRLATPDDAGTLAQLAALDSAAVPTGPVLLGSLDGSPAAAIALTTGAVVADPFRPTAALVALLRLRADHLRGPARSPGRPRLRWPRGHRVTA